MIGNLHAKHAFWKRFYSRPVFLLLLIFTLLTLKAAWNMYDRREESEDNLQNVAQAYEALKSREAELSADIDKLKTDRGIEEEIRKKYSVVKPGEEMVVVVDGEQPEPDNDADQPGFFSRAWRAIKGIFGGDGKEATSTEDIEEN